jgi:hypothetical protein
MGNTWRTKPSEKWDSLKASLLPFVDYVKRGTEHFQPQVQDLFVETQTDEASKFDVHLSVRLVVSQVDRLDAPVQKLKSTGN